MITFINHMRVNPENTDAFEAILARVCANVRETEPGAIYYSFASSDEDPNIYVVIEVFCDDEALRAHGDNAFVQAVIPEAIRLIEDGNIDVKKYVTP